MRIGQGYDVHGLVEGRELILGGVRIDYEKGLAGHSDADVLTHAIMDALLGAAGLEDIGRQFPPTDAHYKDANSMELLKQVLVLVKEAGFSGVVNVDATIVAERPKVGPYVSQIKKVLAEALGVEPSAVAVKATTTEGLGFAGRGEGIAAMAICLIK
ncbi:MAG: 2-C-methyl-D-erythritol 2,4-cyclodiphosphate synthase [bacterium]|nr:2-C-methyl-D-erythritol 2,4-cyclodiphosphate synthase [bacterium]